MPRTEPSGVRFAPSPTGDFHLGNLRTAWISHLWAKALKTPWIVRFEDIDRPRVIAGAMERQLDDMEALGLVPDRIDLQSRFEERHRRLFELGVSSGKIYPCYCSRKEVQASAPHGPEAVYSGRCRGRKDAPEATHSTLGWRFMSADPSGANDFLVARTAPDRSSFMPSYHWACAIDDWDGAFQLLVRAVDLGPALTPQREIQQWIAEISGEPPRFAAVFHTSLVVQNDGHRLEKRTQGVTLKELTAAGLGPVEVLARFDASFDRSVFNAFQEGLSFGEEKSVLSLNDAGLNQKQKVRSTF